MDKNVSKQKTIFVSNTFGTSLTEVFLVATVPILCCMFYAGFKSYMNLTQRKEWFANVFLFLLENLILVLPSFLVVTLLSNHVFESCIVLFIAVVALHGLNLGNISAIKQCFSAAKDVYSDSHYYLTNYKAQMQICTAICILAVDFNIFPRRFAKAEVYGIGVMDMAVGSLVFSNALTSTQARTKGKIQFGHVIRNVKSSLVLFVLGALRVALVKGSSYQEHVAEYGVHWNFFFTLALIKPMATFVLFLLPWFQNQPCYLLISAIFSLMYQLLLSRYGLLDIIQNGFYGDSSRTTFLDANREGIFSCMGCMAVYFAGLFFGKQMFKENVTFASKIYWLSVWLLASTVALHASITYVTPISRQMVNLSYYLLQIVCNAYLLIGYMVIDLVSDCVSNISTKKKDLKPRIVYRSLSFLCRSINRNLLLYFMLANVGTGLINFTVDTLNASVQTSVLVNLIYLGLLNFGIWIVFTIQL